jgi:conjugal transfer ATP-binding protein TraC
VAVRLSRDEASLVAELPYWEVHDGVVVLRDGTYEVGVEFELPSNALAPVEAVNHLARQVRVLLRHAVPEGERLRLLVEAGPQRSSLADAYGAMGRDGHPGAVFLREARERVLRRASEEGRVVEYRGILTCTYRPPAPGRRRDFGQVDRETFEKHMREAKLLRTVIASHLERAGIRAHPAGDGEAVAAIWRYFNPMKRRYTVPPALRPLDFEAPPEVLRKAPYLARPTLRSQVVTSDVARRWSHLWCDDHFIMVVSMDQLPAGETHVGMTSHLLALPYWYWLVVDFVHDPYGPAVRALEAQARRLYAQTQEPGPFSDYVDPRARVGLGEVDQGLQHTYATGSHVFRVGISVVLVGEELEDVREAARRTVDAFSQMHGLKAVVESAGLMRQWLQLAPYSGGENERVFRVFEENAADFFPASGPWRGRGGPVCVFGNRWDGVTAIDPFDPSMPNWNAIVAGSSGSGKTFLVQSILAQLLALGVEAVVVDRGYGYEYLVRAVEGQVIPIDPAGGVSINPFDLPEGSEEPDEDKKAFLVALLRSILPPVDRAREPVENAILESAVIQAYARATTEERDPKSGELRRRYHGTQLSDLATVLVTMEEVGDRPMGQKEKEIARELAGRLQHWVGSSAFGRLLDRPTNVRLDAPVLYFETSALERYQELLQPAVLLLADVVWRRVRQNPQARKVVVVDEAWAMLADPTSARFIVELYRRFRRYGAAVYTVTQALVDFRTPAARGILENSSWFFLGQLPQELQVAGELFRLPDRAVALLGTLSQQKGVFSEFLAAVRSGEGLEGDVVVVRPTPEEYWMFTTFDRDVPVRARAVEEEGGDIVKAVRRLASGGRIHAP